MRERVQKLLYAVGTELVLRVLFDSTLVYFVQKKKKRRDADVVLEDCSEPLAEGPLPTAATSQSVSVSPLEIDAVAQSAVFPPVSLHSPIAHEPSDSDFAPASFLPTVEVSPRQEIPSASTAFARVGKSREQAAGSRVGFSTGYAATFTESGSELKLVSSLPSTASTKRKTTYRLYKYRTETLRKKAETFESMRLGSE